jgi:hypothetical protein
MPCFWIPGSRFARPGMTNVKFSQPPGFGPM